MTRTQSSVIINGAPALAGTTVFRGDVLQTRNGATAMVKMRSGSTLALSENSEVGLDLADPTAVAEKVDLHHGAINLQNPSHQAEMVTVAGASVLVQGERGFPAICRVAMLGETSAIMNDRGHVEVRGNGGSLNLPMGKYVTLEAGSPQGGTAAAGTVSAEIPAETVQHGTAGPTAPLKVQDAVFWGDTVQTQNTGRVRIGLKDGSTLNVGARSTMKIVSHDAQTQQTAIELTAGKLRSQVQKIDKQAHPDGKFEVTTQTAVIGVVGTEFVVEAEDNKDKKKRRTTVWCIEGVVKVRNIDAAIVGVIALTAGEFTTVLDGLAPAAATPFSPGSADAQVNQTTIGQNNGGGGNWGGHTIIRGAAGGASATGAIVSGVAISDADTATGNLDKAGGTLNGIITILNNANTNSNNATGAANGANQSSGNTNNILQTIIQSEASPTYPCGCH
jgi:ferric-dicitrate binding protein FerR (iron transport regulator)